MRAGQRRVAGGGWAIFEHHLPRSGGDHTRVITGAGAGVANRLDNIAGLSLSGWTQPAVQPIPLGCGARWASCRTWLGGNQLLCQQGLAQAAALCCQTCQCRGCGAPMRSSPAAWRAGCADEGILFDVVQAVLANGAMICGRTSNSGL